MDEKKLGLPRSILMLILNDKDTGAPLAFMSANILSAYRTGAVPGVGFKYFAGEDAKTALVKAAAISAANATTAENGVFSKEFAEELMQKVTVENLFIFS